MGINFKTAKWLEKNTLEENLSMGVIGRQELNLSKIEKKKIGLNFFNSSEIYADNFLKKKLKLSKLISFDKIDYEEPSYIKNFEEDIDHTEKFDIFFDGGSLHHIFNVPKALSNINKMTKIGGKILHTAVFNNFQGFGLYQFSPEIFFSLYSKKNGFKNTQVYLATSNNKYWYEIKNLNDGEMYHFNTNGQIWVYVSTIKEFEQKKYQIDQKFYLTKNRNKNKSYNKNLVNIILYLRNILFSIFSNFFMNFDKKLKKKRIN
ncbi:class I SAM-dependent methyltransferase [Candidatus Pelagibacter sp.]|nr:class I SAM-dependent methyltransferase [Candidatus Pelagibacter sp.]